MMRQTPLRIAIDAHRLISETPYSSGAVYLGSMLGCWIRENPGVLFDLLVPSFPAPDSPWYADLQAPCVRLRMPKTPANPVASYRAQVFWQQVQIPRLLWQQKPQVYFSPFHLTPVMPGPWAVVSTIHDVCFLNEPFFTLSHLIHRWQVNTARCRANKLICVSEFTRMALSKWAPGAGRRCVVVPNGLTREMMTHERATDLFRRMKLPVKQGRYFIWVGRPCQERKNIPLLMQATKAYCEARPDCKLVMLVNPEAREAMVQMAVEIGVSDSIVFISKVKDDDRDALYRLAAGLLFPSTCEGFGYPVLEAMLQGCPPIAAQFGPAEEIVGDACTLCADFTVASFLQSMRRDADMALAERQVLEQQLRLQAERFSVQRMACGTLDALMAVAAA